MIYSEDFHLPIGEQPNPLKEGWHRPQNSRKWHYYTTTGRSLCGKWVLFGGRILQENQGLRASEDDCAKCAQRRELLRDDD